MFHHVLADIGDHDRIGALVSLGNTMDQVLRQQRIGRHIHLLDQLIIAIFLSHQAVDPVQPVFGEDSTSAVGRIISRHGAEEISRIVFDSDVDADILADLGVIDIDMDDHALLVLVV